MYEEGNPVNKQGEDLDSLYLGFKVKDDPWNLKESRTSGLYKQLFETQQLFLVR